MDRQQRLKLLRLLQLYEKTGNTAGSQKIRSILEPAAQPAEQPAYPPADRFPEDIQEKPDAVWGFGSKKGQEAPEWVGNLIKDAASYAFPTAGLTRDMYRGPTIQDSSTPQALGALVGSTLGRTPVGIAVRGALGTGAGEALYQGLQETPPMKGAEKAATAAATDIAMIGALEQVPRAYKAARDFVLRKGLGMTPEEAAQWVIKTGANKIPTGVVDISRSPVTRGFRTVLGRAPILGTPIKVSQQRRAVALMDRIDEVLDNIAPITSANQLGIDVAKNARHTSRQLKRSYVSLYNSADKLASKSGEIVPTERLKGLVRELDAKYGRPSLEKQIEQTVPGSAVVDQFGRPVVPASTTTVAKRTAMAGPKRDEVRQYIQQFDELPEYITVKHLRAIQKDLNQFDNAAHAKGFNKVEISDARTATDDIILDSGNWNYTNVDPEVAEAIINRYGLANRIFIGSQLAIGESKRHANPVASQIKRAGQQVMGGKSFPKGSLNEDELADVVFKARSPEGIRQLRTLAGEDTVKKITRRFVSQAIEDSIMPTKSGLLKREGITINPDKLRDALGLTTGSKASRDSLNEMLRGTGVSVKNIEDFLDTLATFDEVVAPATMLARRMTLGGIRSALRGATGVGALAAGSELSIPKALLGVALIRKGGRLLTDPEVLKDVIGFARMEPDNTSKLWRQNLARMIRLVASPDGNIPFYE